MRPRLVASWGFSLEPVSQRVPRAGGAGDRFETGVASDVGQHCWLHRDAPWISCRTDCGVIGVALTVTPRGARASLTAFARHAPGAIAPPSPTPFMPNGVNGDGVQRETTSIGGTLAAFGNAYSISVPVTSCPWSS